MSGAIGIPCNDSARFSFFMASVWNLKSPPNTAPLVRIGSDRIRGRNVIVRQALDLGAEWLLFLDDDHAFGPDLLMRLLSHDKPIVASLYLGRAYPFAPMAFSHREDDDLTYRPINLHDYPVNHGLVKIRAAGTGGMLIRTEVFRDLVQQGVCDDGVWFKDGAASEDLVFCERCREVGYDIYVDLQAKLGHCSTSIIWPGVAPMDDGTDRWCIGAQVSADYMVSVHFANREEEAQMDAAEAAISNGSVEPPLTVGDVA